MKRLISILMTVCMCISIGMVLTACGDKESHEHAYKTEWAYDDTHHWHACEGEACTEVSNKAEHTYDENDTLCSVCGYERKLTETALSKSDLSEIFINAAAKIWNELGVSNVTTSESALSVTNTNYSYLCEKNNFGVVSNSVVVIPLSYSLPNEMAEITDEDELLSAKADAATMVAMVYMVGKYYANENFIISDKALSFDVTSTELSSSGAVNLVLTLLPRVEIENNKVCFDMIMSVEDWGDFNAYYNFEIGYDFSTETVLSYRLILVQMSSSYTNYTEQQMTQDKKYYELGEPSYTYKAAVAEFVADLEEKKTNGLRLEGSFSEEFDSATSMGTRAFNAVKYGDPNYGSGSGGGDVVQGGGEIDVIPSNVYIDPLLLSYYGPLYICDAGERAISFTDCASYGIELDDGRIVAIDNKIAYEYNEGRLAAYVIDNVRSNLVYAENGIDYSFEADGVRWDVDFTSNQVLKKIKCYYEENEYEEILFEYTEGLLTKITTNEVCDDEVFTEEICLYYTDSVLTRIEWYENGEKYEEIAYTYDENEELITINETIDGTMKQVFTYTFDENGFGIILRSSYYYSNGDFTSSASIYEYGDNGLVEKIVRRTYTSDQDTEGTLASEQTYQYNGNGKVTSTITFNYNSDGSLESKTVEERAYDIETGKIVEKVIKYYDANGSYLGKEVYTYDYSQSDKGAVSYKQYDADDNLL